MFHLNRFRSLGVIMGIMLLVPAGATAAEAESVATECTDAAWKEYNACLVESCGRLEKMACDIVFFARVAACVAEWQRGL